MFISSFNIFQSILLKSLVRASSYFYVFCLVELKNLFVERRYIYFPTITKSASTDKLKWFLGGFVYPFILLGLSPSTFHHRSSENYSVLKRHKSKYIGVVKIIQSLNDINLDNYLGKIINHPF